MIPHTESTGASPLLIVEDLCTYFRTEDGIFKVLENVKFSLRQGKTFGIIGESGCGMSTAALPIMGLPHSPPAYFPKGRVLFKGVDLLSLSGHKIYGPKGVGALYIRRGVSIVPLFFGGHHESNFRAGTENVASIVGLGKACEIALRDMERSAKYLAGLRDKLQAGINKGIEQAHFNGHPTRRLPNILNLSFKFIEGEAILLNLDMKGIAVSTGPACTSASWEPSHVLMAMGVDRTLAQGSLRLSPGMGNTDEDIAYTIETLVEVIKRLRYMSPLSIAVDKNNNGKSPGKI